ncbi:hypothetical protein P3T40_007390 [Paraburkholderia sp. EB58]|uniref:hypothetical protein n=1 Tax=Paraburkholderia sp. EB58 TaxID=3035125 RepID=UPI003D1DAF35
MRSAAMVAGSAPQLVKEKGVSQANPAVPVDRANPLISAAILDAKGRAMKIKTFTYEKMLNAYYLRQTRSRQTMEDHIVEMLQQGWVVMSGPGPVAKVPRRGCGLPGDTMIIVFKKG